MRELTAIRTMPLRIDDLVSEDLTIRMPQWRAHVSVQIERAALTAMEAVTLRGVPWPCHPNTTAGRDPLIWWMAPERWLVSSEELRVSELITELSAATEGHLAAIVDVSDSVTIIQLVGKIARQLLARGTSIGLNDRSLVASRCARTRLANLAVLLRSLEEDGYELLVDRSEGQFLIEWLRDSAAGLELPRRAAAMVEPVEGSVAVNAND